MVELGELEKEHEKFDSRGVQIVAVSLDGLEDSARTQEKLKHLVIVSDKDKNLAHAAEVIAPQHAPDGAGASPARGPWESLFHSSGGR